MTNEIDELELGAALEDCGCGDKTAMAAEESLASPEEMEAALDDESSGDLLSSDELEVAGDDLLSFGDDLVDLPEVGEAGNVTLCDVIALAEKHPGLNITISYR